MAKKQKSGLYRSKVKIGVNADGKDIYKYISGRTKRQLEEQRQQVIAKYIDHTALADDRLFGEYTVEWFNVRKRGTLSDSSRESYRTALNKYILPTFGERRIRSIRPLELQEYVNGFAGCSQTKLTYIVATLKGIFKAACIDRILDHNPMEHIQMPDVTPSAEKRPLTPEERATVEAVCWGHRFGAYLAGMYYLGLRPGENRGLQWGDFDWERRRVHVQRDIDYKNHGAAGALKNPKSDRWVPVPEPLYQLLYYRKGAPDQYVFCGERSRSALSKATSERMWIHLMCACGLAVPRAPGEVHYGERDIRSQWRPLITAHTLRHNYIVMCWEAGVDVYTAMRLVGHANITTIMGIYMHLTEKMMGAAQEQLGELFSGRPANTIPGHAQHMPHAYFIQN